MYQRYQFEIDYNTEEVVELFKGVIKIYAYHKRNKKALLEKAERKLEMCIQACEVQGIDYTATVDKGKSSVVFSGLPSIYRLHNQEIDLEKKYEQEKNVCKRLDEIYGIKERLNRLDSTHRETVEKIIFEEVPLFDYALTKGVKKHHITKLINESMLEMCTCQL